MRLNIITPLSRPNNLEAMYESMRNPFCQITWWIMVDPIIRGYIIPPGERSNKVNNVEVNVIWQKKIALAGHAHRNKALELITDPEEWVMSLDDDNIIHPDFFTWMQDHEGELPGYSGVLWDQVNKDGTARLFASPWDVRVNCVDTAQFMFRRGIVEDLRFKEDAYAADGIFIEELYKRHSDKFKIAPKALCYYNYLR